MTAGANAVELERLIIRLVGDAESYLKMLAQAEKQTQTTFKKIEQIGKTLTKYATTSLGIFAGLSVKAFSDFDKAMTESTAIIIGVTDEQKKRMRDLAKQLSTENVQSATELAQAYYFLASAGLDAERSMAALPAVAKFATAGAFDMALATDLLTDAQTALGLSSEDAEQNLKNLIRVSDVFVRANSVANTSVKQISEAFTSDAGAAVKEFGTDLETGAAILSAYASGGKKAAEAGNLFGRMTRLLKSAHLENAAAFQRYEIDVIDETTGEYKDLIDILSDLDRVMGKATKPQRTQILKDLGFETLAQKSLTPLFGLVETARKYRDELKKTGQTQATFDEQMTSFANQMKLVKNQVNIVAIEIGEVLAPVLLKIGEGLKKLTEWWRKQDQWLKTIIVAVGALVAILGPLLMAVGFFGPLLIKGTVIVFGWVTAMKAAQLASMGLRLGLIGLGVAAVMWIKDAIPAYQEYKRLVESTKQQADDARQWFNQSRSEEIQKAVGIEDLTKRKETLEKLLEATKEYSKELNSRIAQDKQALAELREKLDKTWSGPFRISKVMGMKGEIEIIENQMEDAKKRFEENSNRVREIGKALSELAPKGQAATKGMIDPEALKRADQLKKSIEGLNASVEEQIRTFGMSDDSVAIYKLRLQGATGEQLKMATTLMKVKKELEEWQRLMDSGKEVTRQFMSPQEKLDERTKELNRMLEVGAISFGTYQKAVSGAEKEMSQAGRTADILSGKFDAVAINSAEAASRIDAHLEMLSQRNRLAVDSSVRARPDLLYKEPPARKEKPGISDIFGGADDLIEQAVNREKLNREAEVEFRNKSKITEVFSKKTDEAFRQAERMKREVEERQRVEAEQERLRGVFRNPFRDQSRPRLPLPDLNELLGKGTEEVRLPRLFSPPSTVPPVPTPPVPARPRTPLLPAQEVPEPPMPVVPPIPQFPLPAIPPVRMPRITIDKLPELPPIEIREIPKIEFKEPTKDLDPFKLGRREPDRGETRPAPGAVLEGEEVRTLLKDIKLILEAQAKKQGVTVRPANLG